MLMRKTLIFAMFGVVLTAPAARAWNDTGHMTVAMIAWRQLNDRQRQQVAEILRQHPHYRRYLTADVPSGMAEDEWAFLMGSIWSDWVRPARPGREQETFKGPEITRYNRGEWHWINIPWVPPDERKKIDPTTLPVHEPPSAYSGFAEVTKQLESPETSAEDRAVALTWLEHIVGDIHQPLHAITMWSQRFPQGDHGGGESAVRANGAVVRLHTVWDTALGTSNEYDALTFHADHILGQAQHEKQRLAELAANKSIESWARESYDMAIAFAYLNGRLEPARFKDWDGKAISIDDVPPLPSSYSINAHDVVERRIALAGHRLAEQIKRALPK
jgi:hypothetical protein